MTQDFDAFFTQHERRMHYQIHRLHIPHELYDDFFSEGLAAMWRAYDEYDENKGNIGTLSLFSRFDEFIDKRNKMISTDLRESYLKITCPTCSQIAMELNPANDFVYCHFCMTKSTIEAFLTLYSIDFFEIVHEGGNYTCPNCHGLLLFSTYETESHEHVDVCESCIEYVLHNE